MAYKMRGFEKSMNPSDRFYQRVLKTKNQVKADKLWEFYYSDKKNEYICENEKNKDC